MSASSWKRRNQMASKTSLRGNKHLEKRQPLKTFTIVKRNELKALLNITQSEQRDY